MFGFFNSYPTVLVTEGDTWTGYCGARSCLQLGKFSKVVVAVRDRHSSDIVKELEKLGAHIKKYDPSNRNTLPEVFKDVDTMLFIPPYETKEMVKQSQNIIEVAEKENVKHVLMWSKLGVASHSSSMIGQGRYRKIFEETHKVERLVKDSKIDHECIFRIGFIVQGFFALSHVLQNKGIFPLPTSTGKVAPVNGKDVGYASARLLACHHLFQQHNKQTLTLTGPHAYNGPALTQILNSTLQTRIEFEEVTLDEMREILEKDANLTEDEMDVTLGFFELWQEGKLDIVSRDIEHLMGGKVPTDVKQFFEENQDAFRPHGNTIEKFVLQEK